MSHDTHDTHHDTAEEVKKAVVLAILIIAGLATAIAIFVARARPVHAEGGHGAVQHAVQPHRAGPPDVRRTVRIPARSRPELVPGARNRVRVNPRVDYARYLNRSLRAKGRTCAVRARGGLGRTLEISWTKDRLDREHLEQLKTAQGFVDILRERGFDKLELKVDDKVVWRRAL